MDIEKTIQFILNTQAKIEVSAQGHEGRIAKLEASMAIASDLIGRLAQAEIRLAERMDQMVAGFQEVKEIQATGEYKLNALIDTVDKLIRRDRHQD